MSSGFPIAESPPGGPPQSFEPLRELTGTAMFPTPAPRTMPGASRFVTRPASTLS